MARLSISQAWVESREHIRRHGNLYISVALALLVLPQTLVGLVAPNGAASGEGARGTMALMLLAMLVGLVGQLALVRLATGPSASVGEAIAHGARRLLPTLAAFILFGLGVVLLSVPLITLMMVLGMIDPAAATPTGAAAAGPFGLALLLVIMLALLLSVRLILILPVSSAERLGPLQILRRSWHLTAGRYGRLLAFLFLLVVAAVTILLVASILGGITARLVGGEIEPMSLGALIAAFASSVAQAVFTILSSVMLARIYVQLAGAPGTAETSVPSSGT